MPRPLRFEYDSYFETYISKVTDEDPIQLLKEHKRQFLALMDYVDEEKSLYRYAEKKWTIKEVLGHIIDTERIFAARAVHFARGEKQRLTGYDQDEYIENGHFNKRSLKSLIEEYTTLRDATVALVKTFSDQDLQRSGVADGKNFTVNAIVYIIIGHEVHHTLVLKERYGLS